MSLKPFTEVRYAYHLTYPKLTPIITSGTYEKPNAMAASWHTHVSFDPPLYCVAISPKRYTYELIRKYGDYAVNFLPFTLSEKIWLTGNFSGREIDKFSEFGLRKMRAKRINAPIIEQSLTVLECKVTNIVKAGDHYLFIGEIVHAWVREDLSVSARGLLDIKKAKQAYYVGEGKFVTIDDKEILEFQ